MFTIGDFARLGRVSVRMLRHYDAIGLLEPARVDRFSGYRFYTADQLSRLNRIVALKELGFTLQQVQSILDEKIEAPELRGMLRLRRAQLEHQLTMDIVRLAGVNARLRLIEIEGHMNTHDVILKPLPAIRLAVITARAESYAPHHISPVISPLYDQLHERMRRAGMPIAGACVAYYEPVGETDEIDVHAAFEVAAGTEPADGVDVVALPAVESAATLLHHGSMDNADETYQALARWIEENGYRVTGSGLAREIYLDTPMDDHDRWVTEMQIVVTRS